MWYNKNNNNVLKQKLYFEKFGKGNDMLNESIKKLVTYGMETGLVPECERNYTINLLLDLFHQDDYEEPQEKYTNVDLESTLKELLDEAVTRGIIEDSIGYRDLFDTKIMNCLMPRPAQVQQKFKEEYAKSPECATAYFYKLSQETIFRPTTPITIKPTPTIRDIFRLSPKNTILIITAPAVPNPIQAA